MDKNLTARSRHQASIDRRLDLGLLLENSISYDLSAINTFLGPKDWTEPH